MVTGSSSNQEDDFQPFQLSDNKTKENFKASFVSYPTQKLSKNTKLFILSMETLKFWGMTSFIVYQTSGRSLFKTFHAS